MTDLANEWSSVEYFDWKYRRNEFALGEFAKLISKGLLGLCQEAGKPFCSNHHKLVICELLLTNAIFSCISVASVRQITFERKHPSRRNLLPSGPHLHWGTIFIVNHPLPSEACNKLLFGAISKRGRLAIITT